MSRVRLLVVTPLRELTHRPLARLAAIRERRNDARRLEKQALANAIRRYDQLSRFESGEHLGRYGKAGDDDVGTRGVEPWHRGALIWRHVLQHVEDVLELLARKASPVCRARGLHTLAIQVDAGEVRERPTRTNDLRATPVAHGHRLANVLADGVTELPHALAPYPRAEEFLGQPDGTEWQRDESLEQPVRAERELERSAADVHDERSPDAKLEVRERAAERQTRLLL